MSKQKGKSLLEQVQDHIEQLKGQRSALMHERSQLDERREALLRMPLPRADVLQLALAYVDQQADIFLSSDALATFVGKMAEPGDNPNYRTIKGPVSLHDYDTALSGPAGLTHVFGINAWPLPFTGANNSLWRLNQAACFYFGDAIKAKLEKHFDSFYKAPAAPEGEALIPIPKRRDELATIALRISEIDAEVAGIDGELRQVRDSTDTTTAEERAARSIVVKLDEFRAKAQEIYRLYNGKNADEVARKFRMSVAQVQAIGGRGSPDFSADEARSFLKL